ncbi:CPBP family intramembrane metalloprotease [Pediococcus acidilactici]|jgi:membrane protease YdiL (CAAX protease family)|uniref:CPBP family intramembrane glutamic endopeptidase n=1 Tax=Pediococcus acidilactici TaxID=1254 RepID=UPI0006B408E9|nr:type II CAAX endopeptidase family protein [Pediococcus acidilactici]KAF0370451.1 CPBP family intramembrane metalloprotease [Pediococcus acidilactici]KAF0381988.1 CPBP family intramembrane metalloprotease [Pediococcus acidilactici]KAF0455205.1 CPBP family intramembrane metalloprotease [Pediococcus acidilactici]KAF0474750.1 CPBP family intramembrane metalloprotease [Pediococcus acidilactici]KAF0535142.1 CPBP family intramembrane metalloprotease [Pediococcus acidilactici]
MKISKSSLLTLITYLAIFLLPSVINLFVRLGASFIWVETIDYLVGAALLVVINLKNNEINQIETRRIPFFRAIAWGIIGTALVIVLQFVVSYVAFILGQNPASANTATLVTLAKINPFFVLAITVGAPIMEELVFRKVLFGNLSTLFGMRSNLGLTIMAIISSLAFAFMHNDSHIFLYAAIGLLFCWLYHKTGRIQTSMIAHILMNGLVVLPLVM